MVSKKKLMLLYIAILHMVALYFAFQFFTRNEDASSYQQEAAQHLLRLDRNILPGAVLFIGSSSVEGLDVTSVDPRGVNMGIGGEKSEQTLARILRYQSIRDVKAVVLAIGFNDLRAGLSPTGVGATIDKITDVVPAASRLVLSAVSRIKSHVPETADEAALNLQIDSLNKLLEAVCSEKQNCVFVDINNAGNDSEWCQAPGLKEADAIHLNRAGYRCWEYLLRTALSY